jgi:hypothetical protein
MENNNERLENLEMLMREHTHNVIDLTSKITTNSFVIFSLPGTLSQTAGSYGIIFVATRPCFVKAISYVHTVAGTSPTLQVERLSTTTAPGSGTVLMTSAFSGSSTANTVQRGALISQTGLRISDRIALKVSGTLTNYQGATVTIELEY